MNIDYEPVAFMNTYYEAFVKDVLKNLYTVVGVAATMFIPFTGWLVNKLIQKPEKQIEEYKGVRKCFALGSSAKYASQPEESTIFTICLPRV